MAENSGIEWTDHTWNPWWGCVKVSEACRNCYAATWAKRYGVEWGPQARRRFFGEKHWQEPLKWDRKARAAGKRARVFCASMADVFEWLGADHPDCEEQVRSRYRLFRMIEETPNLDWLLLTKRPENIEGLGVDPSTGVPVRWATRGYPPNVWVGTTVEDQEQAEKRIPELLKIPARVRFLSCEPLLSALDFGEPYSPTGWLYPRYAADDPRHRPWGNGIDWVIAGGESGHGARPMHPEWARGLREQCQAAGVPFFFKQFGQWAPCAPGDAGAVRVSYDGTFPDVGKPADRITVNGRLVPGEFIAPVGKKAAGRLLDGRTWDEMPQSAEPSHA